MVGKTVPLTPADRERFAILKDMPCIACWKRGMHIMCGPTEIHHLLSGNRRRGHQFTVPLGSWHHRAVFLGSMTAMETVWGPSLANGSKPFHREFGTDNYLLELTNQLMGERVKEIA